MKDRQVRVSKFLSLVLRHEPWRVGVTLDRAGWVAVSELLAGCGAHGFPLAEEELRRAVESNDKRRFEFSEDGARIRASQGHSVEVELGYEPAAPPEVLYHGTTERFAGAIRREGLVKGSRHHVHLSGDAPTALKVGARRGRPVVLGVRAGLMHADGHLFFRSANGVWLTERVPPEYLVFES
jgi:putative RNA 2'-phosphotransferase